MSKAWKAFERQVAKWFDGRRRVRMHYGQRCEDVHHPHLMLECKYGKQVPKYLLTDVPLIWNLTEQGDSFWVVPHTFLHRDLAKKGVLRVQVCGKLPAKERKNAEFLTQALDQAAGYGEKTPVLCVKQRRQQGFNVCWRIELEDSQCYLN